MKTTEHQASQDFDPQLLANINKLRHSRVTSALEGGTNLHKVADSYGATLLHFATADGNHRVMKHLIALGADVNAQDRYGGSPLMLCLKTERFWTMKILLEAGADIHLKNSDGLSALAMILQEESASWGMIRLFFEVVKRDCPTIEEIVQVMSSVDCPIYHAVLWTNARVTQSRIDAGCCVNARHPKSKKTALHVAVRLGDLENVEILLDNGAKVNAKDVDERTPLTYLNVANDSERNLEILRLLLTRGAVLYKCQLDGRMRIYHILKKGVRKVVRVLLDRGVSLSRTDDVGHTPVHYLALNENDGCIEELRGKKFDANFHDEMSCTPLQLAACAGLLKNVEFLLDNGADVNGTNWNFMTPLFYAAMTQGSEESELELKRECIELLLQRGADASYEGGGTHTVLDIVQSFANYALSKPILLHLAVRELLGTPITKAILERINALEYFRRHLDLYRRQAKEMQASTICESVSLFQFIAESDQKIARYARNPKVVKRLARMGTKGSSRNYCRRYLKKRVTKAIRMAQVNKHAAVAVDDVVKLGRGCYAAVVDRIANYLSDSDVRNLLCVRR